MRKGIYLIGILLVPSVIYLLFSLGEHNMARLGFYGQYDLGANGDTIFLPAVLPNLETADGATITSEALDGKVVLMHFFNWPCHEACKTRLATLNNYLHKYGNAQEWVLISAAMDSISTSDLKDLSAKNLYNHNNWKYTKGDQVAEFHGQLMQFNQPNSENDSNVNPMDVVVLLDQQQRIRSYFNLRLQQDNKRIEDAIKILIQEPHISWKTE